MPGDAKFSYSLTDDSILKPRLEWLLSTDKPGKFPAEFSYVTGGMSWQADYNIVAPEKGDLVDIVGWVTIDNQSGKTFENSRIKLMAGDVNKIQNGAQMDYQMAYKAAAVGGIAGPAVTEKAFDEYHLYTLERSTTLRDRETKQVEFIHANGVTAKQLYVYDGAKIDYNRFNGNWDKSPQLDRSFGTESNTKIAVMREFVNSQANHLGMPLPKGRVRFYRSNDDGQMEFTGENMIDPHSRRTKRFPRIFTGNAFGSRWRTPPHQLYDRDAGKSFRQRRRLRLRSEKSQEGTHANYARDRAPLSRKKTGRSFPKTDDYQKKDSQTIDFPVTIAPDGEKVITYTAHYTW